MGSCIARKWLDKSLDIDVGGSVGPIFNLSVLGNRMVSVGGGVFDHPPRLHLCH